MANSFNDKVVLISGEVSELSMGVIHSFLKDEAVVIFPAKSLHQVEAVKAFKDINQHRNFISLLIDVQDFDKVIETCEAITDKFGKIDIAVEIPEFSRQQKELTETSIDEWNNMMETDMAPFFMGARIVLNMMRGNLSGMFVHITDGRFFDSLKSCALARVAFTARLEMSKIFAEEAQRHGIRYYHLWAGKPAGEEEASNSCPNEQVVEKLSSEVRKLYLKETYNTEMALQSFPKHLVAHVA